MHATQAPLPGSEIVLIGAITSAVVIAQATWPLVQHFEVMAHEGMHAVVGSFAGRTVTGIELDDKAGGGTGLVPDSGPGFLLAGFAGYLGPSAFGLLAARMIEFGHIIVVLWVAVRIVWDRATGGGALDAQILKGRTGVPMTVWHVLWLCGTLTAVVIGAHWMLFPVHPAVHVAPR